MNNTQQAGEAANPFKEWLETKDGKSCMLPASFLQPRDMQYLENRLWWAYTAGMGKQLQDMQSPTPAPDAVEAKGRMDAEEFWQTNIAPNNANKEFVVPSWALNFAEKYAAYLAGHAEGQKATVEAKSAGVWAKAKQIGDVMMFDDIKYLKNELPPTSHAEGEKGAVGFAEKVLSRHDIVTEIHKHISFLDTPEGYSITPKNELTILDAIVEIVKAVTVSPIPTII